MVQEVSEPLSLKELKQLLDVRPDVILVAGQALSFWADYYGVTPEGALLAGITRDIDFLGMRGDAQVHAEALTAQFPDKVKYTLATIDTPPPSVAVIVLEDFAGRLEPIVIDYISTLKGYEPASERRLKENSVPVEIDGKQILVMHPFDCLKSRLHNVVGLASKRNEMGFAQLSLAINVMRAHLANLCSQGWAIERQEALRLAGAIIALSQSRDGVQCSRSFDLQILEAIPVCEFSDGFRQKRWPQVVSYMSRRFKIIV